MMFGRKVLHILHLTERFGVTVVRHTAKGTVGNGLEISISSEGSVVLVDLFVSMSLTPSFISVSRLRHSVLDSVRVNHLIINY